MARQPRIPRSRLAPVRNQLFNFGNGCWTFFDSEDAVYPDPETAKRAWHGCRREVWAQEHRFRIPKAAEEYDGLTCEGWDVLWRTWNHCRGSVLAEVLTALTQDRAAVEAFERRDPRGAAVIGDYLDMWREDLDTIEREARRIAALGTEGWAREPSGDHDGKNVRRRNERRLLMGAPDMTDLEILCVLRRHVRVDRWPAGVLRGASGAPHPSAADRDGLRSGPGTPLATDSGTSVVGIQ